MAINGWREAVTLPVVGEINSNWSLDSLDAAIKTAVLTSAAVCKKMQGFVALSLSGGIDSTLMLSYLRELGTDNIRAFTIGGSSAHADVNAAQAIAREWHIEHEVFIPTANQVQAMAPTVAEHENPSGGAIGVLLLYMVMASHGVKVVLAGDGIDEQLGGYWAHRAPTDEAGKRAVFEDLWAKLESNHMTPLEWKANYTHISVLFPYLQENVVRLTTQIPLDSRTTREQSKIPLREIARLRQIPEWVIERKKKGFCGALDSE